MVRFIKYFSPIILASCLGWMFYPDKQGRSSRVFPIDHRALNLETGDLIFKKGSGWRTRAVLAMDRQSHYSHVGLISHIGGFPTVIHAAPPNRKRPDRGRVVEEFLDQFLNDAAGYSFAQSPSGFPFTRLGYTYDWHPDTPKFGPDEYIIRANSTINVLSVEPTAAYCGR